MTFFPYISKTAWATKNLFTSFYISFWRALSWNKNFSNPMTESADIGSSNTIKIKLTNLKYQKMNEKMFDATREKIPVNSTIWFWLTLHLGTRSVKWKLGNILWIQVNLANCPVSFYNLISINCCHNFICIIFKYYTVMLLKHP